MGKRNDDARELPLHIVEDPEMTSANLLSPSLFSSTTHRRDEDRRAHLWWGQRGHERRRPRCG